MSGERNAEISRYCGFPNTCRVQSIRASLLVKISCLPPLPESTRTLCLTAPMRILITSRSGSAPLDADWHISRPGHPAHTAARPASAVFPGQLSRSAAGVVTLLGCWFKSVSCPLAASERTLNEREFAGREDWCARTEWQCGLSARAFVSPAASSPASSVVGLQLSDISKSDRVIIWLLSNVCSAPRRPAHTRAASLVAASALCSQITYRRVLLF